jgi:sigma-E factor negative regulatory protein RseA
MTDPVKEQLSACLDGELPEGELDLLLKQVSSDPQLRESLGRYALIGEALRGQGAVAAPADFSKRITAAIDAEPPLSSLTERSLPARRKSAHWQRPAAGFAIAAGVAALAILALQQPTEPTGAAYVAETTSPAQVSEPSGSDPASYIVPANTSNSYVPAARLTNYVVAHSEYSTPLGRRSVLTGVLSEQVEDDADQPTDDAASEPESTDDSSQP